MSGKRTGRFLTANLDLQAKQSTPKFSCSSIALHASFRGKPVPDIFLSYNREDTAVAQAFRDAFTQEGLDVWWDATLRSGETYDEVTEAALRGAKAVVVLWSPRSVASRWVRTEATIADRNCTLVPAMIEPCERPIMFELTQTVDLSHWRGDKNDAAWRTFLADVYALVKGMPEEGARSVEPAASAPNRDSRPSIAVLPFINRSGIAEDDIFADGMVEDLTAALSVSRRMKVMAASATSCFRYGARDLRQIGRDLGVRYLLEGNVRRAGDDLRVTAQLVEAEEGDILWTQKFDRPLTEVGALQEALVSEVAAYLGVEVQRAEMAHALRKPDNITAWEAVLRAEAHLSRQSLASIDAAIAEARRATVIAPDYDAAWGALAVALSVRVVFSGEEPVQLKQELTEVLARLRALDTNDPVVLARFAAAMSFTSKLSDALPFAERAVDLNSNLDTPHIALGNILARLGRLDEAIVEFDAAELLAPNGGVWGHAPALYRSVALLVKNKFDDALVYSDQALRRAPSPMAQTQRLLCLFCLDRRDEALQAMNRLRTTNPEVTFHFVEYFMQNGYYGNLPEGRIRELVASLQQLWVGCDGS
jgi:TolB-like protein